MHYGVSFYPEHRGEEEIAHDLSLMADAGINVVRMGEFAWCRFEPAEGDYRFDWLDRVVDRLGALGIASIICTPTACPPAWLVRAHPEVLYQDNRGVIRPFGGRRLACYNNPLYRDYSERIATEIGRHYGSSPNVLGFQIDNELAQEGTGRCHCPVCREGYRQWLSRAYGSIQALNARMGTVFWSQEYDDFGQIEPPISTIEVAAAQPIQMYYDNPSLRLAFERFASDSLHAYQKAQADALRRHTNKTVTTNATGLAQSLPCGLTGLFGITVAEVEPVFRSNVAGIRVSINGETLPGANKHWAEVLEPTGAELVGTYADTFRKGQGVISRNRYGKGTAHYVGTGLSQDLRHWLLAHMAASAGIRPAPFVLPSAVEAVTRTGTGGALYFLFNFRDEEAIVELSEPRTEVQTGRMHGSRCTIPARGYVALH